MVAHSKQEIISDVNSLCTSVCHVAQTNRQKCFCRQCNAPFCSNRNPAGRLRHDVQQMFPHAEEDAQQDSAVHPHQPTGAMETAAAEVRS